LGILDSIRFIHDNQNRIEKWTCYCNNQALINRLNQLHESQEVPYKWQDSDIIFQINQVITPNGNFKHGKGHQILEENEGTIKAKLNILADKMANEAINGKVTKNPEKTPFQIIINQKPAFKIREIKEYCHEQVSQKYMREKFGQDNYEEIDWSLFQVLAKRFANSIAATKLINSMAPTQAKMYQIKQSNNSQCQLCNDNTETVQHVLTNKC
jgi:hypothetical protein